MNPAQIIDIQVRRSDFDQSTVMEIHTVAQVISVPMDDAKRYMLAYRLLYPRSEKLDKQACSKE